MDCSPPGFSVHGILQARILEWVAIPSSMGSSQTRDWTQVSCITGRFFTIWATREAPESLMEDFKKENAGLSSVQLSRSVVSNSLQPHGLHHARPSCPSPTPRVYSNSRPLSRWCHPTILSSVIPFSSRLQSFPALDLFQWVILHIRWPKYWSFSFSISPTNEYSGLISFRKDWSDLLAVQGTLKSLLNSTVQKHQFFSAQLSL